MKFCPECGAKTGGSKFCPDCGRSLAEGTADNSVIQRSTVQAQGALEDSVVSQSTVKTDRAAIKDAVISHSTITQTETHQHFGESVGTFETQMELGRTAFEGKNYDEAVDFFNTALKIDSRSFEPWFLKGLSCAELRRTEEAVTNLRRALRSSGSEMQKVIDEIKGLVDRTARTAMVLETQAHELLSKANIELQYSYQYKAGAKKEKEGGMASALALDLFVMPGLGSSMRTSSAVEGMENRQEAQKREAEGKKLEDQAKDLLSGSVRLFNSAIRFCDLIIEFSKQDEFSFMKRGEIFLRLRLYPDACKSYDAVLSFNTYHREALRLRGMCYRAQGLPIPPPPQPQGAPDAASPPQQPVNQPAVPAPQSAAPQGIPPPEPITPPAIQHPQPMAQTPVPPAQPRMPRQYPQAQPEQPQQQQQQAPPSRAPQQIPQQYPQVQPQQQPQQQAPPPQAPAVMTPSQMQQHPGARQRPAQAIQNPCPYCRNEMSFVKERGAWFCGSCRRFSGRPAG
jgi:tetratricopeptide (TPR) repeat protein